MAEKKIKWTEQQERAIGTRGSDVLVTASAGTGKTAVLSGRYVDVVSSEGKFGDVRNILVVTFTEMAAEQMRSRIAEQLRGLAAERKERRLAVQLVLLDGADISTIHSFCKRLITEYFYELGLDPRFGIIDGDEQKLLKAEVLEKTIEWAWEQGNLVAGMEQLLYRRDLRTSEGFLSKVTGLSDFLDGVISRDKWLERAAYLSGAVNPFAGELGVEQKRLIGKRLEEILEQLVAAKELYQSEGGDGKWLSGLEDDFLRPVAGCIEFLEAGKWDGCVAGIRNFGKPTVRKPKEIEGEIAEVIRKTVKGAVDGLKKLCELAVANPDYADRVGGSAGLQTKILVELVRKFDHFYGEAKRAVNRLDFADLEHYALRLLSGEDSAGEPVPSETALALRERYKYIFVDEYQDINPVQQAIIKMLSSGDNVFVVGDTKQSIYAFRGAEPGIFLERLKAAVPGPEVGEAGVRVELNMNWRSVKGILDFVNKLFGRIMTSSFIDIDYDDSAKLRPGMEEQAREGGPVTELHILDEQGGEEEGTGDPTGGDEDIISSRQRQAMMIAQRIRRVVGAEGGGAEFQVYDKRMGGYRDVEYGDIVILMRSPAKRADDYVEVLRLAGVPVSCESSAGYFEATEISDCICLLKVLDNPQRDIELAAVLRSPFFKISDDELAKVRLHGKSAGEEGGFYGIVCEYAKSGADSKLAERLGGILTRIDRWREAGRAGKPADLLWRVYRETGFLSFVTALPSGRVRRANLLKLHERAIQFEGFASSGGVFSLARFVEFMEKLREVGGDWSSAEPESEAEGAVRIISVHKSKGLEFPVVFIAELNSKFNMKDIGGDILADAGEVLGLQVIEKESNSKLSSLGHQVAAERRLSASLAEEMRILYVAMTRARERLILSGCGKRKGCSELISEGFLLGAKGIRNWQQRRCKSALEWVLYGLSDQRSLHEAFGTGLAVKAADDGLFSLNVYGQRELEELKRDFNGLREGKFKGRKAKRGKGSKGSGGKLLSEVKESLGRRYRFLDAVLLPAKSSVSELTHRGDEYFRFDYSRALERVPSAVLGGEPDLAVAGDGRELGTAVHLLISRLDLAEPVTEKVIEKEKKKLVGEGCITEATAGRIDAKSIAAFFESELGEKVLDVENRVLREWPFSFGISASELWPEAKGCSDELIIVQGIIDMLVRTPEGILVIDFKTDNITAEQVDERSGLYRRQLELYGRAAGAILKEETVSKWLYFLGPGQAFEI